MKLRRFDHKFRFQLLARWLIDNYQPGKAADVGGSKGLLAYILNQNGWNCEVIDPFLPDPITKYKNIESGKRILVSKKESTEIPRRIRHFEAEMAKDYDLLIGLHAHGSNLKIIDGCEKYHKKFVLLPCCVVHEPIEVKSGINWQDSLAEYAENKGFKVEKAELNFKGQNKIIFVR
jgi:hypothetical protein